ncbi:replicative DNA helicase [endosymbiont of Acanthamoeba sp. UWC8]|uniref:replicative DNA helicase n=1 Tax=endosymbiont of Acanthamoeba sp. UWC8 TaxID=86106 RepID=UPI0004D132C4|nr:replicative DNA helicase [endosymbiont of Acanthamoeba sp. UWC8]AIF81931.1 replicative DNA helicase [endosymbiont of Acanthamoeba sp. UWC8]
MKAESLENIHIEQNITQVLREQPSNVEAEQGLLGALLNNNEHINKVADFLIADHFYLPLHKKIYENIIKFIEKGLVANPITLKNYLEKEEALQESGIKSFDYLVKLAASATTIVNVESFARLIYECAIRRKLITIGEDIVNDSFINNSDEDGFKQIEKAEQKLFNLAVQGQSDSKLLTLKDSIKITLKRLDTALKRGGGLSGVTTGFIELDNLLGGLQSSDLLILAARPSMGKTSLAINMGIHAAESFLEENKKSGEGKPKSVAIFSLEMSAEQVAMRMLSVKTKINGSKIRLGTIRQEELALLSSETNNLNQLPVFIDDTAAISISALRTRARRLKRQHNLGLVIVDYLQLLTGSGSSDNRVHEIGEISQGLKAIAKELDVPVLALSQLSRAVESREDKRPQLSDLRESGNIEQDADVVMFIYREEYYLERRKPVSDPDKMNEWQLSHDRVHNTAEVIVSKQRNGPIGSKLLYFDSSTTAFGNLDINMDHHNPDY